jgi:hypothetical protein
VDPLQRDVPLKLDDLVVGLDSRACELVELRVADGQLEGKDQDGDDNFQCRSFPKPKDVAESTISAGDLHAPSASGTRHIGTARRASMLSQEEENNQH